MVNSWKIDEDHETIWTSDRKEYDSEVDLEETIRRFGQEPESDMDLEQDHETIWTSDSKEYDREVDLEETIRRSGQDPESLWTLNPLSSRLDHLHRSQRIVY
jgi:hypothetical protein